MFRENAVKLGIAPINWTNDDMPELGGDITFEQCVSEMALAGFTGTEVGNKYPRDPIALKKALSLRKVEIASAWFSAFLTTEPFEHTTEAFLWHRDFLHEMGAEVIVVSEQGKSIQGKDLPLFKEKPVFTDDEWEKLSSGLNMLGELANEKGMKLVFHHHMGTGVQTAEEIDRLMQMTDPNLVHLLYDTGHLYLSGENPIPVLERYLPRIKHVHLKDVRIPVAQTMQEEETSFLDGVRKGVFTVPGNGNIDFEPILHKIGESDYRGWLLVEAEQDPAIANPLEYALMARQYLKDTAGV
ncbi:myo-inosose-2 dehydratase [Bacillus sp. NTK071]|uniref:Inosose dehydratase n=1 Tax=Guptibacillus hwajinpoensis TaxID=208199 RepID=A0A4U1MJM5_9BACL|nr:MULTISPECIES: myo-inosose-2 dehydratase [Bacillaceae]MBN8210261.1 myo-inosose-2 dehydratase [Bacillus sp. NTK071]TKD70716.1 myo-inosose-2 dehydratase [Pseudalkalibacillus hwajinpoensis]